MYKKKTSNNLGKVLLIVGYSFVVGAIFCLIGPGITITKSGVPISMFAWIFGDEGICECRPIGLIIMFVLQILVILLAVIIIIGFISNKIPKKGLITLIIISCCLILTCSILSFCSKRIIVNAFARELAIHGGSSTEISALIKNMMRSQKIGFGAIMYGSFTGTAFLCCVGGLIAY